MAATIRVLIALVLCTLAGAAAVTIVTACINQPFIGEPPLDLAM